MWTEYNGFRNLPIGEFIVTLENGEVVMANVYRITNGNGGTVDGHFHFDKPKVIAAMAKPAAYVKK